VCVVAAGDTYVRPGVARSRAHARRHGVHRDWRDTALYVRGAHVRGGAGAPRWRWTTHGSTASPSARPVLAMRYSE
jgi:hypothetical protein